MSRMNKKFTPKFFYIKKTDKYRYAGQTTKNVYSEYDGSGVKWSRHLKKHNIEPETEVAIWCESPEDFQKCLDYYVPHDYVESEEWANACEETPWDNPGNKGYKWTDKQWEVCGSGNGVLKSLIEQNPNHQSEAGKLGGAAGLGAKKPGSGDPNASILHSQNQKYLIMEGSKRGHVHNAGNCAKYLGKTWKSSVIRIG